MPRDSDPTALILADGVGSRRFQRNPTTILPGGAAIRQYPFVEWSRLKSAIQIRRGQHALSVGGTGSGKSTVMGEFLPGLARACGRAAVCVSKGMDEIFMGPYFEEYRRIERWPPRRKDVLVLMWPPVARTIRMTAALKKLRFQVMFDHLLLRSGNCCIAIDEEHYMSGTLGLAAEITDLLEQGRSAGISLWNNTQRPSSIPLATYVNSHHGFFFTSQEEYDVRRLGRMRNKHTTAKEMMHNVEMLDSYDTHEHLYLDRSGRLPPARSIVQSSKIRKRKAA